MKWLLEGVVALASGCLVAQLTWVRQFFQAGFAFFWNRVAAALGPGIATVIENGVGAIADFAQSIVEWIGDGLQVMLGGISGVIPWGDFSGAVSDVSSLMNPLLYMDPWFSVLVGTALLAIMVVIIIRMVRFAAGCIPTIHA